MLYNYISILSNIYSKINNEQVAEFCAHILQNLDNTNKIYCIGNGGGIANMAHIMIDFNKILLNNKRLSFIALNNIASITAIGNDIDFESIFSEQLKNLMNENDILFAFSVSGESPDILKAVQYAKSINSKVLSITITNTSLSKMSDITIEIPIFSYQIVEDIHLSIAHYLRLQIEHQYYIKNIKKLNYFNNDLHFIKNKINAKIGFTCGAFDFLHPGHIQMFKDSKNYCDYLIVGLHNDPSLERKNKNTPIQILKDRMYMLNSIKYVDYVIIYNTEKELIELLKKIQPHIRIIGSDWKNKEITGKKLNIKIHWHERNHNLSSTYYRNLYKNMLNK